jgi:hypothetical protein
LHRVTPVGFDAVARLFGHEGGRDDPAHLAFFRQITIEPVPTGSRFIDEDQVLGFCLKLAHDLINVDLPGADRAEVDDLSIVLVGDRGHRDGVLVDIQTDVECARVIHG